MRNSVEEMETQSFNWLSVKYKLKKSSKMKS